MTVTSDQGKVAVSFSGRDSDWVERVLESRLRSWGLLSVRYTQDFRPGQLIKGQMRALIESNPKVLVVITRSYVRSEFCMFELRTAVESGLLQAKVIPVVRDPDVVPGVLDEVTWCNLHGTLDDDENEWRKLCAALGGAWTPAYGQVKQLIRDAAEAEMAAYRALPSIDAAGLERYFMPGGDALGQLLARLRRKVRHRWTLADGGSDSHALIDAIRVTQTADDEYHVRTSEAVRLVWARPRRWPLRRQTMSYDQRNEQNYLVRRLSDGRLAVASNRLPQPADRRWRFFNWLRQMSP